MILAVHDLLGIAGPVGGVVMLLDRLGKGAGMSAPKARVERGAYLRSGEIVQPTRYFHHVRIRVVNDAILNVGHLFQPSAIYSCMMASISALTTIRRLPAQARTYRQPHDAA